MRSLLTALTFAIGVLGADALCRSAEPPSPEPSPKFLVAGYLPEWELGHADRATVALLDQLIFFSIKPRPDGQLDTGRAPAESLRKLDKLRAGDSPRLLLSVGGWGRSRGFAPMAGSDSARATFVKALAKYCRENHFAGADFDWEFPKGKAEQATCDRLLVDTKAAFASQGLALSVAVIASQQFSRDAIAAVDRFHLMSYDHGGAEHSSLQQARDDVRSLVAHGVPPEKILLGVPFYGRTRRGQSLGWAQIVARFHPAANADSADIYSFNGPDTMAKKVRLAREEKLGGLMIWEIGQDVAPDQPDSLLGALRRAIKQPVGP